MRGRPRKPSWLKRLEGNRGHRPIVDDDVQFPIGAPKMPKSLTPVARREFRFMRKALIPLGGLTVADGAALAAYCQSWAYAEQAQQLIEKHGQLLPVFAIDRKTGKFKLGPDGKRIIKRYYVNPAIKIHKDYLKIMEKYLSMFGLTPASRQKLFMQVR